jgi:hypothetical protein
MSYFRKSLLTLEECSKELRGAPEIFHFFGGLLRDFRGLQRTSEDFRGLQRTSEDFRGLQRTSEDFRGLQRTSEDFLLSTLVLKALGDLEPKKSILFF